MSVANPPSRIPANLAALSPRLRGDVFPQSVTSAGILAHGLISPTAPQVVVLVRYESMEVVEDRTRPGGVPHAGPLDHPAAMEDCYFSADVETDGPIPGPYSMLSFGLVYAGRFDGKRFSRPRDYSRTFYRELKPISSEFEPDALRVNGLDRNRLVTEGIDPRDAMTQASQWILGVAGNVRPVLVAYPLSFDWSWLYWYFVRFSADGSPFNHSQCFDIKTAFAVKAGIPIVQAGRSRIAPSLSSSRVHTHNAVDDAAEQAEIFANVFEWTGGIA